jgi:hypothetical protein
MESDAPLHYRHVEFASLSKAYDGLESKPFTLSKLMKVDVSGF